MTEEDTKTPPPSDSLRDDQPVDRWRRAPAWEAGGLVGAGVFWWLAVRAWLSGDLPTQLVLAAAGILVWALGHWIARDARPERLVAAALALAAATWHRGDIPWLIGAAAAAAGAAMLGLAVLTRRRARARTREWLAAGLRALTRDARDPAEVLTRARWKGRRLDRIRWALPAGFPSHDPKARERVRQMIATRLGGEVKLTWGKAHVTIERRAGSTPTIAKEDANDIPERVRRLVDVASGTSAFGPEAEVIDWTEGDDGLDDFTIKWSPRQTARIAPVATRRRLVRTMAEAADRPRLEAKWDTGNDRVTFTSPAEVPALIPQTRRRADQPECLVHLGVYLGGQPAVWDLNGAEPHALIAGPTRAGKTVFLRTLITGFPVGSLFVLLDPKRFELLGFEQLPGVLRRESSVEGMLDAMRWVRAQMFERAEQVEADPSRLDTFPRLVLVVDEGKQLFQLLNRHWVNVERPARAAEAKDDPSLPKPPAGKEHPDWEILAEILQLGAAMGIHVVTATQQADADWMGSGARNNYAMRATFGACDEVASRMVWGSDIGTRSPGKNRGRAWVSASRGDPPRPAQIAYTPGITSNKPADRAILADLGLIDDDTHPDAHQEPAEPTAGPRPPHSEAEARATAPVFSPDDLDLDEEIAIPASTTRGHTERHDDVPEARIVPLPDRGHVDSVPAPELDAAPDDDPDADVIQLGMRLDSQPVSPWSLSPGDVLLDTEDGQPAIVVSVEPDDLDPDCCAVTVTTVAGEEDVIAYGPDDQAMAQREVTAQ